MIICACIIGGALLGVAIVYLALIFCPDSTAPW